MTDYWPSWRYGPNGAAEIFERAEDVPRGWEDHPRKLDANNIPSASEEALVEAAKTFDHDGDGRIGGSLPKSQRKPRAKAVKRDPR